MQVAQVKALACARPSQFHIPLARFSVWDILQRALQEDLILSYSTVWRWLHEDALRPWFQKQWLFPKDPRLVEKATPVLDLYHGMWQGAPLGPRDIVICGDEMTNLRPFARHHDTQPPAPGQEGRYEFSHDRQHERLVYLALREVRTGFVYGEVAESSGIEPFERLVKHYLRMDRVSEAEHIYLIVDNGPSHHPNTAPARLAALDSRVTMVSLPVHSSWLNQIEIYFSILRRKALTPMDLPDAEALTRRILQFQYHYNQTAEPFVWKYTLAMLKQYVKRLGEVGVWPPVPKVELAPELIVA